MPREFEQYVNAKTKRTPGDHQVSGCCLLKHGSYLVDE